jgi:hypothetical protein
VPVAGGVRREQRPVVLVGVGAHPVTPRSVTPAENRPSSGARPVSQTSRKRSVVPPGARRAARRRRRGRAGEHPVGGASAAARRRRAAPASRPGASARPRPPTPVGRRGPGAPDAVLESAEAGAVVAPRSPRRCGRGRRRGRWPTSRSLPARPPSGRSRGRLTRVQVDLRGRRPREAEVAARRRAARPGSPAWAEAASCGVGGDPTIASSARDAEGSDVPAQARAAAGRSGARARGVSPGRPVVRTTRRARRAGPRRVAQLRRRGAPCAGRAPDQRGVEGRRHAARTCRGLIEPSARPGPLAQAGRPGHAGRRLGRAASGQRR